MRPPICVFTLSNARCETLKDDMGSEDRIVVAEMLEEYGKWEPAYRRCELWLKQRLWRRILEAIGKASSPRPATKARTDAVGNAIELEASTHDYRRHHEAYPLSTLWGEVVAYRSRRT